MTEWFNEEDPFKGEGKHFHFLYRVVFLDGMEYTGIHSTRDLNEPYFGSGTELKEHYKKVGYSGVIITRLSYYWTRDNLCAAENKIVTSEYKALPHVLNKVTGALPPHEDVSTFKKKAKKMLAINNKLKQDNKQHIINLESQKIRCQQAQLLAVRLNKRIKDLEKEVRRYTPHIRKKKKKRKQVNNESRTI
tara:strand:- start:28 stop:600 length:573 start_codon:yes stop_codon:yes gene_type:complete